MNFKQLEENLYKTYKHNLEILNHQKKSDRLRREIELIQQHNKAQMLSNFYNDNYRNYDAPKRSLSASYSQRTLQLSTQIYNNEGRFKSKQNLNLTEKGQRSMSSYSQKQLSTTFSTNYTQKQVPKCKSQFDLLQQTRKFNQSNQIQSRYQEARVKKVDANMEETPKSYQPTNYVTRQKWQERRFQLLSQSQNK